MAKASPIQQSFNCGEVSPLVYARTDIAKVKNGLTRSLNGIPLVQGGWTRRPGEYYVAPTKANGAARLVRFEFSTTQAYILEFGNLYIRFYKDNGAITEAAQNITGISKANPGVLTYSGADNYANGDSVEVSGVAGMTQVNGRRFTVGGVNTGANTFNLLDEDGNNVDTSGYGTYTSGGTIAEVYTVTTTYASADIAALKFTQSADTLYITHPSYAPRKLTRTGHTSWTLSTITFTDGPYLTTNATSTTLVLGSTSGSVSVTTGASRTITGAANNGSGLIRITSTAHGWLTGQQVFIAGVTGTTEANGTWTITKITADTFDLQGSTFANAYVANGTALPGVFAAGDVDRLIRWKDGAGNWTWLTITAFTDCAHVTATISGPNASATTATVNWRLGVWSTTTGFPAAVCFFEDRLALGGATNYPQRIDLSNSGEYENFAPSNPAGTVAASNAVSATLNASDVNVIRWLQDDEKGLLVGTVGGEWIVRPSSQSEALSATNIAAKRSTTYGSANIAPLRAGKATLYVQRSGRKLRELAYVYQDDGFRAPDMTLLSEHITYGGITAIAYQQETQSIIWSVRGDGAMLGFTYERDQDVLGWHRHVFGGYSDSAQQSPAVLESIATIPATGGNRDEVWVIVKRYINGATRRYVGYLKKIWERGDVQADAFYVDSGLSLNNTVAATLTPGSGATTQGQTGVTFTAGSAVFASTDVNRYIHYDYVDANGDRQRASAKITGYTDTTHVTATILYPWPNLTAIASAGWRMTVMTVSGLWHLEGQVVSVFGDGATQPTKTVANGAITLTYPASKVSVGLGYNSDGETLSLDAGAADGTAHSKTQRFNKVSALLHDSLGAKFGPSFDKLTPAYFRKSSDPMGVVVPLSSGWKLSEWEGDYEVGTHTCWRQDQPEPLTILALVPQLNTQDAR